VQTVGVKVLKDKLSEYLRVAAAGETVLVTDRGRAVAEIIAPRVPADASTAEAKLGELVRQGLITPAPRVLRGLPPRMPLATRDELMKELEADRAGR
jgi:antitoxin (DNA-binding transcriptional repressor) of toxin-antitoxin stability system